jgi:gentisate 1,2-dioxygenase
MSSASVTTTIVTREAPALRGNQQTTEQLLQDASGLHTKPLWAQMSRLNPPLPNPRCQPHVWEYEKIRPSLLRAGELITEKQAERRVLMLVNPSRGMPDHLIPAAVAELIDR